MLITPEDIERANGAPLVGQCKTHSWWEAVTGTAVGFLISLALQEWLITPVFNLRTNTGENTIIVLIFTVVSVLRGYGVRRFFNWLHTR